jgi:hypothetical protein
MNNAKNAQLLVNNTTLNALNCYIKDCEIKSATAKNIDEDIFWVSEKNKAIAQRDAIQEALSNIEGDLYF